MISRRLIRATCSATLIIASQLRAQEPQTEAGARASVLASLIAKNRIKDTSRVVADIDELKSRFVRCHDENGLNICAITDEKPVTLLSVTLISTGRASVSMRNYVTMRQRCGVAVPIYPPTLGFTESQTWSIQYKDGKWMPIGPGVGAAC